MSKNQGYWYVFAPKVRPQEKFETRKAAEIYAEENGLSDKPIVYGKLMDWNDPHFGPNDPHLTSQNSES